MKTKLEQGPRATERDLDGLDPDASAPLGWRIATVCALVALLETTATGMVGGSLSAIQDTFGLSDTLAGLIPTAAVLGSLLVALPSAHLADRARRTIVLGSIAVLWTLVALGSAWAPVFAAFLLSRALLGAAAQLNNPAAASLIADAHPARGRAKAYGFERAANYMGLPIGIAFGAALTSALGWRTAFTIMAIPGLIAAIAAFTTKEPARGLGDLLDRRRRAAVVADSADSADTESNLPEHHPDPSGIADLGADDDAAPRAPTLAQLRILWSIASLRSILIGLPVLFLGLGGLFFWSTTYFEDVAGLDEKGAGAIAGGVGGTGILIGIVLGSRLGDRHHGDRPGWRLTLSGISLLGGAAAFAGMILLPGTAAQAACFGLANVGIAMAIPNLTAAVADVVPSTIHGMAFSALQFLLAVGTAIGPPLVGATSDVLGSLRPAMAVLVVPLIAAGVVVRRGAEFFDADAEAVLAAA